MRQLCRLWPGLLDLCLPPACLFCGDRVEVGAVCSGCADELPWLGPACRLCARPLPEPGVCGACRLRRPHFSRVIAPLRYAYPVDVALRRLKYEGALRYEALFAELMADASVEMTGVDVVVPMPLHWRREALRGFNQVDRMAAAVAEALEVPVSGCVRKIRHTAAQSLLDPRQRLRNLDGAFSVTGPFPFQHALLVDDVYTTGTSARQLARALKAAGTRDISVLVLTRAVS